MSEQKVNSGAGEATNPAASGAPLTGATADATAPKNAIEISEKAAAQIKLVQEREGKVGQYLRVSVVGGGCSGLSYKLSFDEVPKEKDKIFEAFGVKLAIDGKSLLFVKGTQLDFTDGLNGQGFVFNNPNAKSSCGCGSSFSA